MTDDQQTVDEERSKQKKGVDPSPMPEHAPGWSEGLASESESIAKADQARPNASEESIKEMQDQTVKHQYKQGKK